MVSADMNAGQFGLVITKSFKASHATAQGPPNGDMTLVEITVAETRYAEETLMDRAALVVVDRTSGTVLLDAIIEEKWGIFYLVASPSGHITGCQIVIPNERFIDDADEDPLTYWDFWFDSEAEYKEFHDLVLAGRQLAQRYSEELRRLLTAGVLAAGNPVGSQAEGTGEGVN